jgi:hypothetical protein
MAAKHTPFTLNTKLKANIKRRSGLLDLFSNPRSNPIPPNMARLSITVLVCLIGIAAALNYSKCKVSYCWTFC